MPLSQCAVAGCEKDGSVRLIATSLDRDAVVQADTCPDHIDYLETLWKRKQAVLNSVVNGDDNDAS